MADFAHSLPRTRDSSIKISNANGFTSKNVYQEVFGGAPKFEIPTFSSRVEDYSEIFTSYNNSSRGSSIPFLDLPDVDETDFSSDVRSSEFDYKEIFGGFDSVDYAVPYEELFLESKAGESSSEDVWTPAETGSHSEESSEDPACSENNQAISNIESQYAYDSVKQFNVSYHKTNQISKEDGISGTTHIAQLNAVPAYTFVVDDVPFQTSKYDNPLTEVVNDHSLNAKITDWKMDGEHFWETTPPKPARGSDQKPQQNLEGNGTYNEKPFLSISDISLRTQPSEVPPPSRPPPKLAIKQGSHKVMASDLKPSANSARQVAASDSSPPFFDVEIDLSSSAAASAAAMKEAMEKAQARLKSAKELMERKKDGLQHRKKMRMKEESKGNERREGVTAHDVIRVKEEKSQVAPELEVKPRLYNVSKESVDHKYPKECRLTRESQQEEAIGEWKAEEQFYELVKKDTSGTILVAPERKKCDMNSIPTTRICEHEPNEKKAEKVASVQQEKRDLKLQAAKNDELKESEKKLKEVREREEHEKKETHEREEYEKKLKEAREQEEHEKKLNEGREREKNEKKRKDALQREENERIQREAREREENDKKQEAREREENERRQKEAREKEENEKRINEKKQKEASEREENERRRKEIREKEENEKRINKKKEKDARQREENERRQKAREREENERRQKEEREREENEKRINEMKEKEARQREENERRQKEALEREENERSQKEEREREENEKRINEKKEKEARQREENERRQKEEREREEYERKLKQDSEENERRLKEVREKEENERKQNEERQREENEKRLKESYEREETERKLKQDAEENERRLKEVHEQEENEKTRKETHDREENEKRPKVPFEEVASEKLLQKETCEKLENDQHELSQDFHVCNEEDKNLIAEVVFEEIAECENKLKAGNDACMEDKIINSKAVCGGCEQEENNRKLKMAQESCKNEDYGKTMRTTRHAFEHRENVKNFKEDEVSCEQDDNETLRGAHMAQSSSEHEEYEANQTAAPKTKVDDSEKKSEKTEAAEEKCTKEDLADLDCKDRKKSMKASPRMGPCVEARVKIEVVQPTNEEEKRTKPKLAEEFNTNQERKGKNLNGTVAREGSGKEGKIAKEREQEKEHQRKLEEDRQREREREREREKDRMAVERVTREARERAYVEARERAERAAVERATAEARQRAMTEARERLEKVCAEAREKSLAEKTSTEARLRAERATVERAIAEARERAVEKAMAERAAMEARERVERSVSEKFSVTSRDSGLRQSASFSDLRDSRFQSSSSFSSSQRYPSSSNHGAFTTEKSQGAEVETAQRCKARLERHQRAAERAAKALAEKNLRDHLAQREQAERNRLAETLDADVKRWSSGKEGNLRALLSTLQYILGAESGWQPVPLTDVITAVAVKRAYRKATLYVHPDKLQQRGASIQQKYICEKVFDLLKDAWNKFNSEER